MKKLLSYPVSVIYYLVFGLVLVVFHVIQFIAHRIFGYRLHKISVDWLNFFIMRCLNILGTRISFFNEYNFKKNNAHIIVANHQSMYDIPPIIWCLRELHPKFISKKELGKGIPSVSYNLKYGGSVLIDRNDKSSAVQAIAKFGQRIQNKKHAAVIFPEGTRSRDGKLKRFSENGLRTLVENCPNAIIVPLSIENSWQLQKYGMFPLPLGLKIRFKVHQPIEANVHTFEQIFEHCHSEIAEEVVKP
jgi:1-acyl-sn-glycerol-3-phosphate acyltransferase